MLLGDLIDRLVLLSAEVGPTAYVFTGDVQSGNRILVSDVGLVPPEYLQHSSWRNKIPPVDQPSYKAVEIS